MLEYQKILNKNLLNVFFEILKEIEKNGLSGNNHLYITFQTNNPKTSIPEWLFHKYPSEMTIIIQHEYYNLSVYKKYFNIVLSFNNKKTALKIHYDSIISFADPSANFGLNFTFNNSNINKNEKIKKIKKNSEKDKSKKNNTSNVLNFSNFKKN